jgi:hemerythrin
MENREKLVTWSSTFSIGVSLIDEQNKGLLDLVNDMFNHVVKDEAAETEYFRKIIQQAAQYAKVHFDIEERIMIHTRFPGYKEHKKAHDAFVMAIVTAVRDYESGKKYVISELTRFLKEWVLTHIAIMDKGYFSHFKKSVAAKDGGNISFTQADEPDALKMSA